MIVASTVVLAFFNPREDEWDDHFSALIGAIMPRGVAIHGLTSVGRAAVQVLGLNDEMRQLLRYEFFPDGLYYLTGIL